MHAKAWASLPGDNGRCPLLAAPRMADAAGFSIAHGGDLHISTLSQQRSTALAPITIRADRCLVRRRGAFGRSSGSRMSASRGWLIKALSRYTGGTFSGVTRDSPAREGEETRRLVSLASRAGSERAGNTRTPRESHRGIRIMPNCWLSG